MSSKTNLQTQKVKYSTNPDEKTPTNKHWNGSNPDEIQQSFLATNL